MRPRLAPLIARAGVLVFSLLLTGLLHAQISESLSGKVTTPSGAAVPNARVSAKNLTSGVRLDTNTASDGTYKISNLTPGDYDVVISAPGLTTTIEKVSIAAGANKTLDIALGQTSGQEPSLSELGFPSTETQSNTAEQARLDKRSHMLKVHQKLGLITAIPLVATVITGSTAGGRSTSSTTRDLHAALGGTTAGLYFTTAYFAIFAPKIEGTHARGPIRLHKALAFIHGPGMVLTPILGEMAFAQKSRGEKVHGIASAHAPVAYVTAIAYGAALLSVSVKF